MSITLLQARIKRYTVRCIGNVAEWLKAPHSKCGIRVTVSRVQISSFPPKLKIGIGSKIEIYP